MGAIACARWFRRAVPGELWLARARQPMHRPQRPDRERVVDANASRRWLGQQPDIRADHISLLGWSNGGSSVLWTIRPQHKPDDKPDFRSAVALYPGCHRLDS